MGPNIADITSPNVSVYQTPRDEYIPGTSSKSEPDSQRLSLMPSVQRSRLNTARGSALDVGSDILAQGSSQITHNWVTVFGFPSSKASFVLKQFSNYGQILDHRVGSGNWMHIL
jgi:nuclear pore complex protein Nup53